MNATGLTIALAVAVVVGVVFGIVPDLDIVISRPLFDVSVDGYPFAVRLNQSAQAFQKVGTWLVWLMVAVPVAAMLLKVVLPRTRLLVPGRAIVFALSVLALGPGLLTNAILKEHWNRPRPIGVTAFGGEQKFMPWWDVGGECRHNCSFVSGDVSMATWTVAAAALAPPAWRALAYGGAFAFAAATAAVRMSFGAHFFTDVVFAVVLTFLLIWLLHGAIYRWPRTRLTDRGIERGLEWSGRWCRKLLGLPFAERPPRTEP